MASSIVIYVFFYFFSSVPHTKIIQYAACRPLLDVNIYSVGFFFFFFFLFAVDAMQIR